MNEEKFGVMDTFNAALLLKRSVMERLRESPYVVRQGFLVVLLVGLIVGAVSGVQAILINLNPEAGIDRAETAIREGIEQQALQASSTEERMVLNMITINIDSGVAIARDIEALPTTLPQPVNAVLRGVGVMVSRPLGYLGGLLLTIVFVHIAARWFGGQGTLQQMVGLGALSVAPHLLDALSMVPVLGSMLGFVSWVWSVVILVIATSVAHQLQSTRATLAVLFFPIIGGLLFVLGCCVLFLLLGMAAGSTGA